jgi:hypothetical protein
VVGIESGAQKIRIGANLFTFYELICQPIGRLLANRVNVINGGTGLMNKLLMACIAAACIGTATQSSAAEIAYTVSGTGTGSIGEQSFSGDFGITTIGDTSSQNQCMNGATPVPGCYYIVNSSTDLNIASLGHFSLTNPSISFVNNANNLFGFSEIFPPANGVNTFAFVNLNGGSALFASWNGISDFGPVLTDLALNQFFRASVDTSAGPLVFSQGFEDSSATFSATLLGAAVPEPVTWTMMLIGFGLIGGAIRRKRQNFATTVVYA